MRWYLKKAEKAFLVKMAGYKCEYFTKNMPLIVQCLEKSRQEGRIYALKFEHEMFLKDIPASTAAKFLNNTGIMQELFASVSKDVKVVREREKASPYLPPVDYIYVLIA